VRCAVKGSPIQRERVRSAKNIELEKVRRQLTKELCRENIGQRYVNEQTDDDALEESGETLRRIAHAKDIKARERQARLGLSSPPEISSPLSDVWSRGESEIRESQREAANVERWNAIEAEDFEFTIQVRLYINLKKTWENDLGTSKRSTFDISAFEEMLNKTIDEKAQTDACQSPNE